MMRFGSVQRLKMETVCIIPSQILQVLEKKFLEKNYIRQENLAAYLTLIFKV